MSEVPEKKKEAWLSPYSTSSIKSQLSLASREGDMLLLPPCEMKRNECQKRLLMGVWRDNDLCSERTYLVA